MIDVILVGTMIVGGMVACFVFGWMAGEARGRRDTHEAWKEAVLASRPTSNADDFGGFPG